MLAVTICSLVIDQTDRVVIAAFLPVAMVTYYAAAWKVYMLAYALTTTLVHAVSPLAADLYGRNDHEGIRRLFLRSTKYTALLAWPLVFTLAFSGGFLLRIWMGARFVSALTVVQVLIVGFAVTAYNHAGYSVLIGMRRVGPTVSRYFLPQALLNLALSIWLVQRLGNVGVALGTTLPALALEYVFLSFVLRALRISWREFLDGAVWPVAVPAVLSYLPLALAYTLADTASPVLPAVAVGCSLLYGIVLWRSFNSQERGELIGYVPASMRERAAALMRQRGLPARRDEQI
jgi:O-antigen/teichoic acid export membrane protein